MPPPDNISQIPPANIPLNNTSQPLIGNSPQNQLQNSTFSPSAEFSVLASKIEKQEKETEKINTLLFLGFFVVLFMAVTILIMFGTVLIQSWEDKLKSYDTLLEKVYTLQAQIQSQDHKSPSLTKDSEKPTVESPHTNHK